MGIFRNLARLFQRAPTRQVERLLHGADSSYGGVRGPLVIQQHGRVWDLPDRDTAMREAEQGMFLKVAQLCDAMRGDGLIRGLWATRSAGMVALPTLFEGDPWVVERLRGSAPEYDPETSALLKPRRARLWDRILPTAELVGCTDDAIMAGVGIGYLDDDPRPGGWRRLRHLDLHYLKYTHADDAWWYQDAKRGLVRVIPGNGRWVLLTPYGRHRPWTRGAWYPCAGPFISKQGAAIDRTRWSRFLADGLRVLEMNEDASETHLQEMVRFMRVGWQYVGALVSPKGYKPGIVESNGKGYEVYRDTEDRGDREIMVALAGQTVTTDGTKGFSSGDIFNDIALSLVQTMVGVTSEWIGVEILDCWTEAMGLGRELVRSTWDARTPAQRKAAAEAAKAAADGLVAIDKAVEGRGKRVKAAAYFLECGVNVELEDIPGAAPAALPAGPAVTVLPSPWPAPQLTAGDAGEPSPEDAAAELAEKMTEHAIERCEHGSANRCRLCGIERVRDFEPGVNGADHQWTVKWRPIAPSSVQASASSRRVGSVLFVVEHPRGSTRSGTGPGGAWSVEMICDYGFIPGTCAPDGEAIDAYGGPDDGAPLAFVVAQVTREGKPDEPKVMLGFGSEDAALEGYLAHVPTWCFGSITAMPVGAVLDYLAGRV